ncbi:MAG: hypothetical protein ACFFD4_36165, partial [Candidatus Odinarchaeota archaeon]
MPFTVVIPFFAFQEGGSYKKILDLIHFFLDSGLKVVLISIQGSTEKFPISDQKFRLITIKKQINRALTLLKFSIASQLIALKVLIRERNAIILTF